MEKNGSIFHKWYWNNWMSIYKKNNEKTFDNFKKIVLDDSLFMMLCQL